MENILDQLNPFQCFETATLRRGLARKCERNCLSDDLLERSVDVEIGSSCSDIALDLRGTQ